MRKAILGAGLAMALAGGLAQAQYRDRYGDRWPYGGRDSSGDRGRYGSGYGYDAVSRALSDLERIRSVRWADGHERDHWEKARRDLIRFQENRSRGRFDRDRLDGAIEHLSHLANARQLHPRDRQMLARNLYELRDFRSRGGYRDRY